MNKVDLYYSSSSVLDIRDATTIYYPARTYANVWLHANFKDVNISLQSLYCFSQKKNPVGKIASIDNRS